MPRPSQTHRRDTSQYLYTADNLGFEDYPLGTGTGHRRGQLLQLGYLAVVALDARFRLDAYRVVPLIQQYAQTC